MNRFDPTRTTLLRRRFGVELTKLFRDLKKDIRVLVIEGDAFGIKADRVIEQIAMNQRWRFLTSTRKIELFLEWLQTKIDSNIIGLMQKAVLTDRFITQGYEKGAKRAYGEVRRNSNLFTSGIADQIATDEFFRINQIDVDRLKALQSRTFKELEGVTNAMRDQIGRELSDGLLRGDSPERIAQNMADRIDKIGINRARAIAQTEIVRAHAEGSLDAMERLGVEEIRVEVEWRTAGDNRVCPLCAPLQGLVLPLRKARGLFPRHPRCRCSPIPADKRSHKSRIKSAIDKSVLAEIPKSKRKSRKSAKQQRRRSRWIGALR